MNSIVEKIALFLKDFAPFDQLSLEDLYKIASSIKIITLDKKQKLFQINDDLHDSFYVVAEGLIHLTVIADTDDDTLLNKCYTGDIFGLRPFFAKNKYRMSAIARKESMVYAIPIAVFKPYIATNMAVLDYLLENFANYIGATNIDNEKSISIDSLNKEQNSEIQFLQPLNYSTKPQLVSKFSSIREAALLMAETKTKCVLVTENKTPIGIVTDTAICYKIAAGSYGLEDAVHYVMTTPVAVIENVSVAEAQLIMLKSNVSHLCVTADGTIHSEIKGIITENDLINAQASNPGVLIKEVKRTLRKEDLKKIRSRLADLIQNSIYKNIPLQHTFSIASEVNFAITKRAVELAVLEIGTPPVTFAWFSIGSQGRKEQLLLSDQDSFLVFEDVAPENYRLTKDYFIKLAQRVTIILEHTGFPQCKNGYLASNLLWCKSVSEWEKQFIVWIKDPGNDTIVFPKIFFDYEIVYGDVKMEEAINKIVYNSKENYSLLFDYLGNKTLKHNNPFTFFKNLQLEEEGSNKNKFDIQQRALLPLVDAARLISLSYGLVGVTNTFERFRKLAIADPKNAEIYSSSAEAFLILTKFKTIEGIKNDNLGNFIDLEEMTKNDKEKLKLALHPMQELVDIIKSKFKLTHFS